jgi:hypothetical protein
MSKIKNGIAALMMSLSCMLLCASSVRADENLAKILSNVAKAAKDSDATGARRVCIPRLGACVIHLPHVAKVTQVDSI